MALANYSLDLIAFYGIIFMLFAAIFYVKTERPFYWLIFSILTVLVGSEYYEIPIFVMAYVKGIADFPCGELHHALIVVMFIILLQVSETKLTKKNVALLLLGPCITAPLLLIHTPFHDNLTYLARMIGFCVLGIVIINSPGVGGRKASNKPNKTKSKIEM